MKTEAFQDLLLKSAVSVVACDGNIDETEISEIRNMAENEIYFMGYDFEKPLEETLKTIKEKGSSAINDYLNSIENKESIEENSALDEIKSETETSKRSILDQITFENYSYYLGFDKL